jgi:hypothetical protein
MMTAKSTKAEIRYDRIFEEPPAPKNPSSRTLLKVLCAALCLGLAVSYLVK